MKRRTLDLAFSVGGLVFAVLLLVVGLVLQNQSNFAKDYVRDQLSEQQIAFAPAENLRGEQEIAPCLLTNAGKPLETGKQAECYSKYIGIHLAESATEAGYDGATYATLGGPQRQLRGDLQAAREANAPAAEVEQLQADLDGVNSLRDTMFRGETLRGLLLTTYGFSIFGDRAATAAVVVFVATGVLALLSIAGLVHAFTTKKDEQVLVITHERELVNA